VAVKIKLMRLGKMRAPYYRIVVADARTKREGRVIETIGKYHPKENPSFIEVDGERAAYWLGVGAQPTEPVAAILKVTGDWQKFKGLPAPAPMLVAEPKADKKVAFEAAAREGIDGGGGAATTPKKKAAPKAADQPSTPAPDAAGPQQSTPAGDAPSAPEAGTGAPEGTDAAAASLAADAASSDKA
jgi:small subunit ribosomal protein S16